MTPVNIFLILINSNKCLKYLFVYCFKDVLVRILAEHGKKALVPVDNEFIKRTFEYSIEENPNRRELTPFPLMLEKDSLNKLITDDIHFMKCGDNEEEVSDLDPDSSDEDSNLGSMGPLNIYDKYIF